jgi:hypothetical protein
MDAMTPTHIRVFFADAIEPNVLVEHCTRVLFARVVDLGRGDLRWKCDDGLVWACDVRRTLAGEFTTPDGVAARLGGQPASGLGFRVDEQPRSGYVAFLVVCALLGRWRGCIITPDDPTIILSKEMRNPASMERSLKAFCEPGSLMAMNNMIRCRWTR